MAAHLRHGILTHQPRPSPSLAYAIANDPSVAEDVTVDAFAENRRQAGNLDTAQARVSVWLVSVVRTYALSQRRGTKPAARAGHGWASFPSTPGSRAHSGDGEEAGGVTKSAVTLALAALPDVERRVVELAYFDGLAVSEIAAELHQPESGVRQRLRSGMIMLRATMSSLVTIEEPVAARP
jgi:RNA polymerase sigma-70 factor (ECF subfamily)